MPSEIAVHLAKSVLAAANAAGTRIGDTNGQVINFLASQIDVAIDLVKESKDGFRNPELLVILLAKKGWAIGGLAVPASQQMGSCMVALGGLSLSLASVAASVPTGLGIAVTGLGLLADSYAAYDSCKGPAQEAYDSAEFEFGSFMFRLEHGLLEWANVPQGMIQ